MALADLVHLVTIQLAVLYVALLAFSAHDIWKRTIPPSLCAAIGLLILCGWGAGALTWWWSSAALAAGAFWAARLPLGDRAGIFLTAGLLPPVQAACLVLGGLLGALVYVVGVGRYRSMIGVPFFPVVALCGIVLTQYWRVATG